MAGLDVATLTGPGPGWGEAVDGRFGWRFGLPRAFLVHSVVLQVEAVAGYHRFAPWNMGASIERIGGGGRVGYLFGWLEPFFVAHASVADAAGSAAYLVDCGGALDWRLPAWSVGGHYGHDWLGGRSGQSQWNELGLHVEVRGYWF